MIQFSVASMDFRSREDIYETGAVKNRIITLQNREPGSQHVIHLSVRDWR